MKFFMRRIYIYLFTITVLLLTACAEEEPIDSNGQRPVVRAASTYAVQVDRDIRFADGLGFNGQIDDPVAIPLLLDLYYPINTSPSRPVFLFIHGGGFQGGTKTKPEIVEMGQYFAARGWVFASMDYRTTEDLDTVFTGIAPPEWISFANQNATNLSVVRTGVALYAAQRDAKAALRWLVANSDTYRIDTDHITVGGASAGAITTIAVGISEPGDFLNEISLAEDPTLATTNVNETYRIKSMVNFWGSNLVLEYFESVYGQSRYDRNDPELFIAHGTEDENPFTNFSEATELNNTFDSIGVHLELYPLDGQGHGAWAARVNGSSLSELVFNFITERHDLDVR